MNVTPKTIANMSRSAFFFVVLLAVLVGGVSFTRAVSADKPPVVRVWPGAPPAWEAPTEPEKDKTTAEDNQIAGKRLMRLANVTNVDLHVFEATDEAGNPSPASIVICPGGGFSILAWDLEGLEIAEQLQASGISAAVLKYRVPTRQMNPAWTPVVQDIQRAIAMVRAGKVFSNSPEHVGVMGFSAGGKASVHASIARARQYESVDEADAEISPPDFACLIYPAWIVEEDDTDTLRDGIEVDEQTPPMFFAHADNDPHQVLNSVVLFQKLHAVGVPSALHIFTGSGHGFGAREDGRADDLWPELCVRFVRDNGWLSK